MHPVVGQLAMIGIRLASSRSIRSQRINSDGTTRGQSPKSSLAGLSNTWSDVRDHKVETTKVQAGKTRKRLADAHASATPEPPEPARPSTTPPEGPSVAANADIMSPVAGRPPSYHSYDVAVAHISLTKSRTKRWNLDFVSGDSGVAAKAIEHITTKDPHSCARQSNPSSSELPWRM